MQASVLESAILAERCPWKSCFLSWNIRTFLRNPERSSRKRAESPLLLVMRTSMGEGAGLCGISHVAPYTAPFRTHVFAGCWNRGASHPTRWRLALLQHHMSSRRAHCQQHIRQICTSQLSNT